MSRPTFHDVRQVLLDLGFQETVLPTSHLRFKQPRSGTVLFFRPYQEQEPFDPSTLVGVRRLLDERGVVERARFDEMLRAVSGEPTVPRPAFAGG
jgi:hypothetical protein